MEMFPNPRATASRLELCTPGLGIPHVFNMKALVNSCFWEHPVIGFSGFTNGTTLLTHARATQQIFLPLKLSCPPFLVLLVLGQLAKHCIDHHPIQSPKSSYPQKNPKASFPQTHQDPSKLKPQHNTKTSQLYDKILPPGNVVGSISCWHGPL